ncbi:MAG TPA: hypothetical protein VE687_19465 [Stellaceae bacterium]|jgi:hypothetical protein|nr:hypothetical protein [Stellaceae bacterium]
MKRREEQTGEHDDEAAEAGNYSVDPPLGLLKPGLKPQLKRAYVGSDELQILLGGDVVMDRVENLGGDAFSFLAVDIRVRESVG